MTMMPTLQTEHETLARLSGSWSGDEVVHPSPWDPAGGTAIGKSETRVALDGFFVVSDYIQERGGQVTYAGHGVYGWDAAEKCYTMHWFDSMGGGTGAPAKGTLEGKTLTFRASHAMGHSKYVYDFDAPDRMRFRIEMSQDGTNWAPFLAATYVRKAGR